MYFKQNKLSHRTYTYCVGRAADNGYFSNKDCAGVILFGAEKCTQVIVLLQHWQKSISNIGHFKVCLDAIQILGGNGYINDYPTGRFLRLVQMSVGALSN